MAFELFTPKYIDYRNIQQYTRGKIFIVASPASSSEYSQAEINDLCAKGETIVERDFNKIYEVPFKTFEGEDYDSLPAATRAYIANICTIQTILLLLSVNFGSETAVVGENYVKYATKYYNTEVRKLLTKDKTGLYAFYPLPDLAFNKISFTGQTTAPTPKIINPLLTNNNAQRAVGHLSSVDRVVGISFPRTNSTIVINTNDKS